MPKKTFAVSALNSCQYAVSMATDCFVAMHNFLLSILAVALVVDAIGRAVPAAIREEGIRAYRIWGIIFYRSASWFAV